jgi:pyruvate ferredoxin oxidoreductase beta subunit
VEVAKLAVETGAWILYEYQDGKLRLTGPSAQLIEESRRKPLEEYLSLQGRFSHLTKEDIEQIKKLIKEQWEWIKKMI